MTELLPRIKELLTWSGVGPAGFADAIGLPRPVMSHILAGRNKPSLEVVQKILARFPEVQAQWLLLGKGGMLISLESNEQVVVESISPFSGPSTDASFVGDGESAKNVHSESVAEPPTQFMKSMGQKKIRQVLLMYEDGTFECFNP